MSPQMAMLLALCAVIAVTNTLHVIDAYLEHRRRKKNEILRGSKGGR